MNNNEQLFELMTKMYVEMKNGFKEIRGEMNDGFKSVNEKLDVLDTRVTFIEKDHGEKLTSLDNKLDDIEASNASRHVLMVSDINEIKDSLSKVEIVTADNWGDIARLKVRENNKEKY